MKFYTVCRVSNFIDNNRIHSFHANMFHGLAEREGCEFPHDKKVWADTDQPTALVVSRTGRRVPSIFRPSTHLVVASSIADQLSGASNIRPLRVQFRKLVDIDYKAGDFTYEDKWGVCDPCELIRSLPDVPLFHDLIGPYFELQSYRLKDVAAQFAVRRSVEIEIGTPPMQEYVTVDLCEAMMDRFPILWAGGDIIMSEGMFNRVEGALDRDFFIVRAFELGATGLPIRC